jgi:shikimate kinase
MKNNIVLIGMPAAGKSTNGLLLAKALGKDFVDTDVLIQVREGKTLQQILDNNGYLQLRKIEEAVLTEINVSNTVIATGGSAVYSDAGMTALKKNGVVVYLETPLATLRQRINDHETRGIAKHPDQSFEDLFAERCKLYSQYADMTIHCDQQSPEEVVNRILDTLALGIDL